jgi:hypothetical protein
MLVEFKKPITIQFKDLKVGDAFIDEYHDVFLKIVDVEQAGTIRNALRLLDCDVWTCHPSEMVVPVVQEAPVSFVYK